jgi:uncharacterized protein (TIGR03437 family)
MQGTVNVVVSNKSVPSGTFVAQAQSLSPSFFVFDGTHVAAVHLNATDIGPTTLYPGLTTPAKPGELVVLVANGFGPTSVPVVGGSMMQSGNLPVLPVVKIGGITAIVQYAALIVPGEYQFNVFVPPSELDGEQPITATYNGLTTQAGALIAIQR